ncbi:beta strand repeat-containing protein, partial [Sphingomonas sp. CCH5-D11]|uniref:beta strand repeat-containing protein n=1 Tax=Sphingomonas sp. CCH5-D11 TaxID=1768786 RepID=UPI003FA6E3D5
MSTPQTVRNTGAITAVNGGAVRSSGAVENSGTITATGTGVLLDFNGALTNTGAIRSTAGTAVSIGYSGGYETVNDGDIAGATTGVSLSGGRFTNNGTITGGSAGVALGGTLINSASGTITGGTAAVARGNGAARLVNAGTINGTVDFVATTPYDSTGDLFVDDGGTVTGTIRLGGGDDELVVTMGADPARPLAGATGGVDAGAGYDTLRYRVNADADAALTLAGGFEGLAYELADDAKLTLTAANPITTTIGLTGDGTVTLNGAISTTDRSLISTVILSTAQLTGEGDELEDELAIVNNGDLTLTTSAQNYSYNLTAAIFAGSGYPSSTTDVTNNGTITVINAPGIYYPAVGIFGGASVTNSGTISVTGGGAAITGAEDVINSGTITASGTAATATGVSDFATLTNSGTIRADGVAVQSGYGSRTQVTNSGTIESQLATAIVAGYYGTVTNEAGGTISGATAVQMSGPATLVNRGAIIGNVEAARYSYGSMIYVADGGTLTGDLRFGMGDDTLILFGDETGISGTIDAGTGTNTLIHARRESSTVTLGGITVPTFDALGVRALGSDTQVTVRAEAPFVGDLTLSGDGMIVNTATVTGVVRTSNYYGYDFTSADLIGPIAFTNEGTIEGGFNGSARSFANTGAITGTVPDNYAVSVWSSDTLAFDNSGTIAASDTASGAPAVGLTGSYASAVDAINSGTITGGISVALQQNYLFPDQQSPIATSTASLTNSGVITADGLYAAGVSISVDASNGVAGRAVLDNSGTIEATGQGGLGAYVGFTDYYGQPGTAAIEVSNAGTMRANGGGSESSYTDWYGDTYRYTSPAAALWLDGLPTYIGVPGENPTIATITNAGTIEATGERSVAIMGREVALDLANSGTITGGAGTVLAANDSLALSSGNTYLAGAIQTTGTGSDRVVNTGTITGSIALGAGDDRIENYGRIDGDVFLGADDDTFLQRASAILTGTVDGGVGSDSLIVDATGG